MKNKLERKQTKEAKKLARAEHSRFPKFGILDAIIILLVIAIAVGIYFRYSFFDTLNSTKDIKECYVYFKTQNTTESHLNVFEKGDAVYFKSNGEKFGVLTVESDEKPLPILTYPAVHTVVLDGKTHVDVEYPQNVEDPLIYGTGIIAANCSVTEDGSYLLNGSTYISVGSSYTVCTEEATIVITITAIEDSAQN